METVTADELPASVFDLADPKWRGKIGWAPINGSFQAFVTAMKVVHAIEYLSWIAGHESGLRRSGPKFE